MADLEHPKNIYKTGTTTVAIMCKDGIILAADRRATAGYIAFKKAKKIVPINDFMAVTTAGDVSEIQLVLKLIKAESKLKDLQTNRLSSATEVANLLSSLVYSNLRKMSMVPAITAFLFAAHDHDGLHLFEIGPDGSMFPVDDYAADGSGSVFALGVLESTYKKNLSIEDGIKLAIKAVNTALQRDIYSGNGIDVVSITEKGVKTVFEKELIASIEA
ncbi:MAG: proteasome subunit beta [Nanoarchaeota archaeon]